VKNFCSNNYFSGIPSGEYNLCGHWRSALGRYPSWFSYTAYFDTHCFQAAKDASASHNKLIDLFNLIEHFFRRLEIYTGITPTTAMTDIVIEIMVELLTILAMATKDVKRGRLSELMSRRFTILR
jgi:transposase